MTMDRVSLQGILNALSEHILVLDEDGTLMAANSSWQHFVRDHNSSGDAGVGRPYQAAFPARPGVAEQDLDRLHAGIGAVLSGQRERFESVYRYQDASAAYWFNLTATPLREGRPGVLIAQRDVTAQTALEADLVERANYDYLTGLANRRFFLLEGAHMLALARRHGWQAALVYLDVDEFKTINDDYGHATGDKVLSRVSARLRRHTRESDLLARIGGDEFVLLLAKVSTAEVTRVVQLLRRSLARPVLVGERAIDAHASFGVAHHPRDGTTLDALLAHADQAMYRAKVVQTRQRQLRHAQGPDVREEHGPTL